MTGTFRPSVRTSPGAVKSAWMRSSLPSLSLSNGAWTQTSPLCQSAGLVEKTAWARPLTKVGSAGCGAGAGAGAATRASSTLRLPGGRADAGLAATTTTRTVAVTAPARSRVLTAAPVERLQELDRRILLRTGRRGNCPGPSLRHETSWSQFWVKLPDHAGDAGKRPVVGGEAVGAGTLTQRLVDGGKLLSNRRGAPLGGAGAAQRVQPARCGVEGSLCTVPLTASRSRPSVTSSRREVSS